MSKFSKTCFCTKNQIKFESAAGWSETAIDKVYCPLCSDRAPDEALLIQVTGVPERVGVYAINFNQSFLRDNDSNFKDSEDYYRDLVLSRKLTFGFLPKKIKNGEDVFTVLGLKEIMPSGTEDLSGPDNLMAKKDGLPTKLPKKARGSPEESYYPQSGYKGHH